MPEHPGNRFAGRTVVTGGGPGIGRATVLRLDREGARVATPDISQERLDAPLGQFPEAGSRSDAVAPDRSPPSRRGGARSPPATRRPPRSRGSPPTTPATSTA